MTGDMLRLADEERGSRGCEGQATFDADDDFTLGLQEIVRRAVVPQLCRTLGEAGRCVQAVAVPSDADHVGALADSLLANDIDGVCARIDAIRACGRSLERIYLDLLMPTAAHLNRLLAQDLRGCAEITVAFVNLQGVMRRLASDFQREAGCLDTGSSALLAAPPAPSGMASLQMFGLLFTAEFFRREGWSACTERSLSSAAFREAIETQWFDVVEVFALRADDLDEIAAGIKLIRRGAPNRDVGVIACGQVFDERPEIIRLIGADHRAPDLRTSLLLAKRCVIRSTERRLLS